MRLSPKRLLSIDVLRAVTMLLMIFVNDASGLKNVPGWIDHAKGNEDAMGFADTIFPAFLFIVGLSLPLAIQNRLNRGDSFVKVLIYILTRSAALLIMGFYHVNLEEYSDDAAILPKAVWALVITLCFFLIWLDYPDTIGKVKKYLLMGLGVAGLIAMAAIYSGGDAKHVTHHMHPSWWGILGIIGWSYLVCALVYLLARGHAVVLMTFSVIFAAINIGMHTGVFDDTLPVISDGSSVSLTMFGVVTSVVYSRFAAGNKINKACIVFVIAAVILIAGGLIIRPYAEGISKIRSTPAWVFICTGITLLAFLAAIYWVDVKGRANTFKIIRPAGTSTLTCYLMPYFQVYLLMLFDVEYPEILNSGIIGLMRSMATAFILIILVGFMEKKRLRLKV
jgi:heparan-alpha-glucosaminide N-acetyltransferase